MTTSGNTWVGVSGRASQMSKSATTSVTIVDREGAHLVEIKEIKSKKDALEAARYWLTKNPDYEEETETISILPMGFFGYFFYVKPAF